jgi:hypothetical protein
MQIVDFHAYYWGGVAVIAHKFGIPVHGLYVGDESGLDGKADLQPISESCDPNVGLNPPVEDYVTTLLAGSAASFIRVEEQQSHWRRPCTDPGFDVAFLRRVWESLQPERERAVAIICRSLGDVDDGNVKFTVRRLWQRAVRLLRQPIHHRQLKRLAEHLITSKSMSSDEVRRLLEA